MIRLCAFADEASESVTGQIAALKRNGIGLIELRGLDGVNISGITEDAAREYAKLFKKAGIEVWSIGSPLGKVDINGDFEEYVSLVHHICRLANIFGARRVRVFSFYGAYDSEDEVIRRLNIMVLVAEAYGVRLCLENEKQIFGDTPERVLRLISSVKGLGVIYDPANYVEVGVDAVAAKVALYRKIDYFHIKDVIAATGELVPAGKGDCNIHDLVADLCKDEDRVLSLEPHLKTFTGYSEIDPTEMKNKYYFETNDEAFDTACEALKTVLQEQGYREYEGVWKK